MKGYSHQRQIGSGCRSLNLHGLRFYWQPKLEASFFAAGLPTATIPAWQSGAGGSDTRMVMFASVRWLGPIKHLSTTQLPPLAILEGGSTTFFDVGYSNRGCRLLGFALGLVSRNLGLLDLVVGPLSAYANGQPINTHKGLLL